MFGDGKEWTCFVEMGKVEWIGAHYKLIRGGEVGVREI